MDEPGWVKLDDDDTGWPCEGEGYNGKEDPPAVWGFKPYEDAPYNEPAYLCDSYYEAHIKKEVTT